MSPAVAYYLDQAFYVAGGLPVALFYTVCSWLLGTFFAFVFFVVRFYKVPVFSWVVVFLVSILRGTPLLVQVVFFYYCLPSFGINLPGPVSALLAFVMNSAAYTSEVFRGSFLGISKGQVDACKTLGIPSFLMWKDILFPQLLRISLPSLASEFVTLFKDTSILYVIGGDDIMRRAYSLGSINYSFVGPLLIAAFYYYLIATSMSFLFKNLESFYDVKSN